MAVAVETPGTRNAQRPNGDADESRPQSALPREAVPRTEQPGIFTRPPEGDTFRQPRQAVPDLGCCGRRLRRSPVSMGCRHFGLLPARAGPLPTFPKRSVPTYSPARGATPSLRGSCIQRVARPESDSLGSVLAKPEYPIRTAPASRDPPSRRRGGRGDAGVRLGDVRGARHPLSRRVRRGPRSSRRPGGAPAWTAGLQTGTRGAPHRAWRGFDLRDVALPGAYLDRSCTARRAPSGRSALCRARCGAPLCRSGDRRSRP